jgi:hypothetical protein
VRQRGADALIASKKKRRTILPPDVQAFFREIREGHRQDRAIVKAAVATARGANVQQFMEATEAIDVRRLWRPFMKAISAHPCPEKLRRLFLVGYIRKGDHIRQEVDDDLILIDGLRNLLPRYTGPGTILYRSEGALNRSRRTYGLAWSASKRVARDHARRDWQATKGGSVLLQAYAPKEAIICAPHLLNDRYAEQEYVVDRRRLTDVRVIERFP